MTVGALARRGLRMVAGWWWRQVRPSTGAGMGGAGEARTLHEAGRPPTSEERWSPSAPATGPWADVDPHTAGRWPRRTSLVVVAAWAGAVVVRVRRELRGRPGRAVRERSAVRDA